MVILGAMNKKILTYLPKTVWEVLFQVVWHVIVFIFYAIDWDHPEIEGFELAFFANYALMALVINYILLPRFLYPKAYFRFGLLLFLLIVNAFLMEELVLEVIYFPDTRAKGFPGVFYTLLDILPVSIALVSAKFGWDAFTKQQQLETLQAVVKESELQFLKSQINPHFLFNNMNNLYAHAIEQSPKTPEIILELSSVLRYMLYDCKAEQVPLGKEVEHLENFINISELQIEERGEVLFEANIKEEYYIAPLILVVFVENAFKHSTASQSENIFIKVQVEIDEHGHLQFSCVNSFDQESNTENLSSGIGLENVQKRLELLYPNSHQLTIKENNNLYEVSLSLQLNRVL